MLDAFARLYIAAPKISQLKPLGSEEYRVFSRKKGLPVALVSVKKYLDLIPHYESFYSFWKENDIFWLIPCDLPDGSVNAFVLRAFAKKGYRAYVQPGMAQPCFGWFGFKDFKKNEPIVLCEGSKDQIALAQFYPRTLGLLTDSVSSEMMEVFTITNKFVIALDKDKAGDDQRKWMTRDFSKAGAQSQCILPPVKDWGMCIGNRALENNMRMQLFGACARFGVSLSVEHESVSDSTKI